MSAGANHGWSSAQPANLTPRESQLLASLQHSTMLLASVPLLSDDAEARAHASRVALAQVEWNRVVMGKCGGAA